MAESFSFEKNDCTHRRRKVDGKSCVTPAGTSNELKVQNEWEENTHTNMVTCQGKAALVRNYFEIYWSCAGVLSAVNAIGTQLRDPINSGLTRWSMAVS